MAENNPREIWKENGNDRNNRNRQSSNGKVDRKSKSKRNFKDEGVKIILERGRIRQEEDEKKTIGER